MYVICQAFTEKRCSHHDCTHAKPHIMDEIDCKRQCQAGNINAKVIVNTDCQELNHQQKLSFSLDILNQSKQ